MSIQARESRTHHLLPFVLPVHPPAWLRNRKVWPGVALAIVLVIVTALAAVSTARSTPPAVPIRASAVSIPVTARGVVQPVRSARVATLSGGVVRQLNVALDSDVTEQSIVAWVVGPASTEVVTAPFGGSVSNVLVHAGDTLMPGTVIAVVADVRDLRIEVADVDEYVVGQVHVGLPVKVTFDALDNTTLSGTVTGVALMPQATMSGNQVYPVTVNVGAMPPDVRAGMSVRVLLRE